MANATLARKDFLSVVDFDAADLEHCLRLAAQLKADRSLGRQAPTAHALEGRHVALLFEKPSLRTHTTFEIAIREVGGYVVPVQPDVALGKREPVADVARNRRRLAERKSEGIAVLPPEGAPDGAAFSFKIVGNAHCDVRRARARATRGQIYRPHQLITKGERSSSAHSDASLE